MQDFDHTRFSMLINFFVKARKYNVHLTGSNEKSIFIIISYWYIFSVFNQAYLIEKFKYLLELKKMLSTELNFHLQLN